MNRRRVNAENRKENLQELKLRIPLRALSRVGESQLSEQFSSAKPQLGWESKRRGRQLGPSCAPLVLLVLKLAFLCILSTGKAGIEQVNARTLPAS